MLVLFEEVDGELRFLAGDDDSGEDRNALLEVKLFKGRRYVARVRLYWAWASGGTAVMLWWGGDTDGGGQLRRGRSSPSRAR